MGGAHKDLANNMIWFFIPFIIFMFYWFWLAKSTNMNDFLFRLLFMPIVVAICFIVMDKLDEMKKDLGNT